MKRITVISKEWLDIMSVSKQRGAVSIDAFWQLGILVVLLIAVAFFGRMIWELRTYGPGNIPIIVYDKSHEVVVSHEEGRADRIRESNDMQGAANPMVTGD